jgi:hypothetical protein
MTSAIRGLLLQLYALFMFSLLVTFSPLTPIQGSILRNSFSAKNFSDEF